MVEKALIKNYSCPNTGLNVLKGEALHSMLRVLPSLSPAQHIDPILVQIQKHHPGTSLLPPDHAIISLIDECMTQLLFETDLDYKVESYLRDLAPFVALVALEGGTGSITRPQGILNLIDTLIGECVGWSEDLGILGDQFIEKIDHAVGGMINGHMTLKECNKELKDFHDKQHIEHKRLENRLCDIESTEMELKKSRYHAAELLNQLMSRKRLPLFIIFMLQGAWYEFLQHVFNRCGQDGLDWQNAKQLTRGLIWCVQLQSDAKKQRSIMDKLPQQIIRFAARQEFDVALIKPCLADAVTEYQQVQKDGPTASCEFDLLEIDPTMQGGLAMDPAIYEKIQSLSVGQWFVFDDKHLSREKVARIKLILNSQDAERLLFTNQNRRKLLHMSYHEFASFTAVKTLKALNSGRGIVEVIRSHLVAVIRKIKTQDGKVKSSQPPAERKVAAEQFLSRRKQSALAAVEKHKHRVKRKYKQALILKKKAARKLELASDAVASLKVDAWVKLPIMEGILTPCKLVAVIPVIENYIFANRAGIKVAEYTADQLAQMIVTENSEILDTGAEFENVLASVISGLRESRQKSYC